MGSFSDVCDFSEKQKRLKEAKEEAKKEILLFKNNQEVAFQDKMAKVSTVENAIREYM